jgi:hypothetical protein
MVAQQCKVSSCSPSKLEQTLKIKKNTPVFRKKIFKPQK